MFSLYKSSVKSLFRKGLTANQLIRSSHSEHKIPEKYYKFRPGHMDEALKPFGSWKESYESYQRKYNRQLALSLLFFGGTMAYLYNELDLVLPPPMSDDNQKKKSSKSWSQKLFGMKTALKEVVTTPSFDSQIANLPDSIPYLIIGGGTASFAAFRSIRANDPKAKVLVVTSEEYLPYMRPPLSKELWFSGSDLIKKLSFKQWNGRERSIFLEHEEFYIPLNKMMDSETGGVSVVRGHKVVKLDASEKKVFLDNGQIIVYDKCLIATGGKPKNIEPFLNGSPEVQKRVILFRDVNDFKHLEELSKKAKSITIVGGGFLGSELVCALTGRNKLNKTNIVINQVFPEEGNMGKVLPEYLCQWTTNKVRSEGNDYYFIEFNLQLFAFICVQELTLFPILWSMGLTSIPINWF